MDDSVPSAVSALIAIHQVIVRRRTGYRPAHYWRIRFSRLSALCLSDLTGLCVHARAHHDLGTTGDTVITQQSTVQRSTIVPTFVICGNLGVIMVLVVVRSPCIEELTVKSYSDWTIASTRTECRNFRSLSTLLDHLDGRSVADYDISSLRICHPCAKDGMRLYILLMTTKPHFNPNERESLAMVRNQIRLK